MDKLNLNNVTLIAISSVKIDETIKALQYSAKDINFGKIKLVTHEKPINLPNDIEFNYIDKINNIDEWNYSIIYKIEVKNWLFDFTGV